MRAKSRDLSLLTRSICAFPYKTKASPPYLFENGFVMAFACPLCAQFVCSLPTRYKRHLALIVVVDKENCTHIAMQALLANERSEDFEFLSRVFRELIGEGQPQVSQVSMCSIQRRIRGPQENL